MTSEIWKRTWRSGIAAVCGLVLLSATSRAQEVTATNTASVLRAEDEVTNRAVETATGSVSNAPGEGLAQEANSASERRIEFRRSFDNQRSGRRPEAIVSFGKDVELKTNETAEAVVVIGGSAIVRGRVRDAVVVIGGTANIEGAEVGDAVVAVMGSVKVAPGSLVHGDVVAVGGGADVAEGATVEGQIQPVEIPGLNFPKLDWLKNWLQQCVFKLRPLAPQVGWVWVVTGAFFLIYLLITVAFPRPVALCVNDLTQRPATTFLMGLLVKLLTPLVLLFLAATGIGLIVVPFIVAALMLGALLGKAALLQYLGKQIRGQFGGGQHQPLLAFLIGWILITLLYIVPILGLVTFMLMSMWGLGVAVTAAFGGLRREMPARPTPPLAPPPYPASASAAGLAAIPVPSPMPPGSPAAQTAPAAPGLAAPAVQAGPGGAVPLLVTPSGAPPVIGSEALLYPKAAFFERMAAAFLDVVLIGLLSAVAHVGPLFLLVALAYFGGLWTWKGTTIGGIVLNLKVVRLDGGPLTFVVALVRGLAAAFSVVVLFLGFLWIAWDRDKQGWHDKIAGTVVVRLPRGMPLVCL